MGTVTIIIHDCTVVFDGVDAVEVVGIAIVVIVLAETSTGAWQPIEEISNLVHDAGALLVFLFTGTRPVRV